MSNKEDLVVSFSGGKTSAYMSYMLKRDYSDKYNLHFVFANTGQEHEKTLEFVDRCDKEFRLGVVWVEAVVNPTKGIGVKHKVVNFETASRNGEPFEAFIAKEGIPGPSQPKCSDRLKLMPIEHWKKTNGFRGCLHAIGIRADEPDRMSDSRDKYNLVYPLCEWSLIDKIDVNNFWESMTFNLEILEHNGNCKTCWKKSDKKLFLIAKENIEHFCFFDRMEKTYHHVKPNKNGMPRVFFRNYRSTEKILEQAKFHNENQSNQRVMFNYYEDENSGCSESCEAY